MPIYKGTTELTKIADLLTATEHDITDVYFGELPVFTVWDTYDGNLPATYSANGSALADYRVYGSVGGVGDDSGTAYGYEVDMSVRSANLFDKNAIISGYAISKTGAITENENFGYTPIIPAQIGDYVMSGVCSLSTMWTIRIHGYLNGVWVRQIYEETITSQTPINIEFEVPHGINGLRISLGIVDRQDLDILMLNYGSTPLPYEPYSNTTTPIYIGDTPLGEDEYVSFKEQKVYRMVNGILTPTDPPVPLPELPSVDGTNIVDYAGQSAAVPSRFVAKYRKEGY